MAKRKQKIAPLEPTPAPATAKPLSVKAIRRRYDLVGIDGEIAGSAEIGRGRSVNGGRNIRAVAGADVHVGLIICPVRVGRGKVLVPAVDRYRGIRDGLTCLNVI